jgi:hypothetical protein
LNEESIIDENVYTISMIIYLLQDDFYGAKYFWKRAPVSIKTETSEFTKVWNINKHLIQNSIPHAFQLIKTTEWSQNISNLIQRLYSHLQQFTLTLIQNTHTTIKLSVMMNLLDMSEAQCQEGLRLILSSLPLLDILSSPSLSLEQLERECRGE